MITYIYLPSSLKFYLLFLFSLHSLLLFSQYNFSVYNTNNSNIHTNNIYCLTISSDEKLYMGTDNYISILDISMPNENFEKWAPDNSQTNFTHQSIIEFNGEIIAATFNEGALYFSSSNGFRETTQPELSNLRFFQMDVRSASNELILGTNDGVYVLGGKVSNRNPPKQKLFDWIPYENRTFFGVEANGANLVVTSTFFGPYLLDAIYNALPYPDDWNPNLRPTVNDVHITSNGATWYSHQGLLVKVLSRRLFDLYNEINSPIGRFDVLGDMESDMDGRLWITTRNNGIFILDGSDWTHITTLNSNLPTDIINAIEVYGNEIYLGTPRGLAIISTYNIIDDDQDGFTLADDCDDNDAAINPNASEIRYNGIDDDCNSATLDDDLDRDGFLLANDCDDNNAAINPNASEIRYNGIDDDCNSATLDDDLDRDGFLLANDCDDNNAAINPNASEIRYNGIDDDCNSATLDDDLDRDGFLLANDCDDNNAAINPNVIEIRYNGIDDDCNSTTLDDDLDRDGFLLANDCDDNNAAINPNAEEIPNNGIDEDCNGEDLISTSIHETEEGTINIFPNPTNEKIFVKTNIQIFSIEIYDLTGRLLLKPDYNFQEINVTHFNRGIYVMKLTLRSGETITEKIIVK